MLLHNSNTLLDYNENEKHSSLLSVAWAGVRESIKYVKYWKCSQRFVAE